MRSVHRCRLCFWCDKEKSNGKSRFQQPHLIKIPLALGIYAGGETMNNIFHSKSSGRSFESGKRKKWCREAGTSGERTFYILLWHFSLIFASSSFALNQNVNIIPYAGSFCLPKLIKEKHTFAAPFFCHPQIMIDSGWFTIYIMSLRIECVVFGQPARQTEHIAPKEKITTSSFAIS